MRMIDDCRYHLVTAGIPMPDADQLRRIAMTLHRWHEMECGDSNDYASWCITRGRMRTFVAEDGKRTRQFEHEESGSPFIERHIHSEQKPHYSPIADRERGALKRLAAIMARYPGFQAYVQTDPRGAPLYILRPGDVPAGCDADAYYSRGIAVHK